MTRATLTYTRPRMTINRVSQVFQGIGMSSCSLKNLFGVAQAWFFIEMLVILHMTILLLKRKLNESFEKYRS